MEYFIIGFIDGKLFIIFEEGEDWIVLWYKDFVFDFILVFYVILMIIVIIFGIWVGLSVVLDFGIMC